MNKKFISALVCAFARAYHSKINEVKIFDDTIAERLLTKEEYNSIKESMSNGIEFFNPKFVGTKDEALRWIVDNFLSPSPLGRTAYAEKMLEESVKFGNTEQYLIFAAGYDTFAYRKLNWAENIHIFEIDHPVTGEDKIKRLKRSEIEIPCNVNYVSCDFTKENWIDNLVQSNNFSKDKVSFCSILGLSYYLAEEDFEKFIKAISSVVPKGSSIIFDYPDSKSNSDKASLRSQKQTILAGGAGEIMLANYSYSDIENILNKYGFSIKQHLNPEEITENYFAEYNKAYPQHIMSAFDNVNYCMAVK